MGIIGACNSVDADPGEAVPDPTLVLAVDGRQVLWPNSTAVLQATPEWAKPLVQAALELAS